MTVEAGVAVVRFKGDYSALNRELASKVDGLATSSANRFGKTFGPVVEQQTKHLKQFTTAMKYATAGAAGLAGYGLFKVVEAGAAFEKQMSVNDAIAEAHGKQLQKLEKQSIKLGQATFYSAKQAAEAQGELIKGGLKVGQVLGGGLPAALSLAEAGQLELAEAAEITVGAMKMFKLEGKEASSVADMLATAANTTLGDVNTFGEALTYGGAAAQLAGYNMNETVTALEALSEATIQGTMAGTTLKTAFIHLLNPTKKQAEELKRLGLDILTSNGHLKNAAELSGELRKATEGMTKAERTKTFATLAGQRGILALNAIYAKSPKYLEGLERANAKTGTAQELAAKKMDNFAGAWEQFKGSLETAEIQIYKGIQPALRDLAEEGERVANTVGEIFGDEHLSQSEKFQKALDFAGKELGKLWDEADIPEHAAEAFAAAAPVIAEAAAHAAVFAAEEFGKAFIHAPFIAKVAMGAWLINFIGGKQAFAGIAKLYGKQFGLNFTRQAEESMAASAPAIVAESKAIGAAAAQAAMTVPSVVPVARQSSFIGPGTGAARKAAAEGAAINDAARYTSSLGIPNMGAALQPELAAQGKAGAKVFVRNLASDIRTGAPVVASSVASMGGSLLRGAATWGIGGYVAGEMVKEVTDSDLGTELGTALQTAGVGAAIGNAIAPGIGGAIGAAFAGSAGFILAALPDEAGEAKKAGEQAAAEFLKGYAKNLPELKKQAERGFLGQAGRRQGAGEIPGTEVGATYREGGKGLRGARAELIDKRQAAGAGSDQAKQLTAEIKNLSRAIEKVKLDRASFRGVMAQMSGDALSGVGQINKDLKAGLAKADSAWGHGTKGWSEHAVEAMQHAKAAIKDGMEAGVIVTDTGQKRINALLRKIKLVSGKDPAGIAEGVAKSFKEAGQITSGGVKGLIHDLDAMPKGARIKGIESIEGMTRAWAQGHPKLEKQVDLLTQNIKNKFGNASKAAEQGQAKSLQHIVEANTGASRSVAEALTNIGGNLTNALKALGAHKLVEFKITQEAQAFHHRQTGGPIPGTFMVPGTGTGDTFKTALPPGSFIENRNAARMPFQTGGLTPVALEPKERVWLPEAVKQVGAGYLHARNRQFPRFQTGGLMSGNLPHPTIGGPEPLRSGAQKGVDSVWKPAQKYLRAHLEPQRVLKMLHAGEAITSKGFPYVYGGGHGSFAIQPVDCSGLVSYILHAGNFLSSPMSVQQGSGLYTLGQSGPGKYFTWGVRGTSGANAHALDVETPILTVDGWKTMGTVGVGDYVYAEDGSPTLVTHVSEVFEDKACYEVEFADGATLIATGDHRWKAWDSQNRKWSVLSTDELRQNYTRTVGGHARNRYRVACAAVPQTPEADLPIDPYVFGYWLGDGNSHKALITVGVADHADLLGELDQAGYRVTKDTAVESEWGAGHQVAFVNDAPSAQSIPALLGDLGVRGSQRKHIPEIYLAASSAQREALLAGLLDSDGCATKQPAVQFSSKRHELAQDVWLLARSLGHRASLWQTALGEWFVSWTPMSNPFRMERKRQKCAAGMAKREARLRSVDSRGRSLNRGERMSLVAIRPVAARPSRCIAVDHPERVFLAGRAFTPTHNTMISVKRPGDKGWAFFESGGSGGGAHQDSGWDGSFQFRHMPGFQKGGQLHGPPLFRGEGPRFYADALRHNQPWATHQAPWSTQLSKSEEASFLRWGKNIDGRGHGLSWFGFDPRRRQNDYDMRGFWRETGGVGPAANGHFTDKWKTPYDTTFSNESTYAKRGTPFVWTPNYKWLYDRRTGQEIIAGKYQTGGQVGMPKKAQEAIAKYGQQAFDPHSEHFVGWGYQRGGSVQKFAKGGWVKVGATIDPEYGNRSFSNHGGMSFAELLQAGANRGLKGQSLTATLGIGPPHYTAEGQDYGMAMGTPIHVKMPGASKQFVMYKNDVGSGQGGNAHYKVDLHQPIANALGWSNNADIEVSTSGKDLNAKQEKEHTYKEEVPGNYKGLPAKSSVHFPSTPKNLDGVNREIDHWTKMAGRYKAAIRSAKKDNRPGLVQDLQHNLADVQNHLRELRNAARGLRVKKAQAHFSKLLKRKFSKLTGYETAIEQAQQAYEKRGQFAEQVVDLEPIQPELPSEPEFPEQAKGESDKVYEKKRRDAHNAYEQQREAAEKAYVAGLDSYIGGKEKPAYEAVLGSENDWRTKILEGEHFAAGDWQKQNFLGGFEGRFEDNIVTNVENQLTLKEAVGTLTEEIQAWKKKVAEWRNDSSNAGKKEPKWIKRLEEDWEDAERKRDKILHEKLPIARSKEAGLRETLGQARELFYPGKAGGGRNGAEKYFELRSNPPTPAIGSGTFEESLRDVQGIHWPDQHEVLKALPAGRVAGAFGGAIWDTQSAIEELGLKITQANNSIQAASIEEGSGSGSGEDSAKSELTELEKEELLHYHQREAIEKSLGPTLAQFNATYPVMPPYAGKAHTGAIVPGPPSAEKTMIVKGREGIFTQEQMAALGPATSTAGGLTVHVNGDIHQDPTDPRDPVEAFLGSRRVEAHIEQVSSRTRPPLVGSGAGRAFRP